MHFTLIFLIYVKYLEHTFRLCEAFYFYSWNSDIKLYKNVYINLSNGRFGIIGFLFFNCVFFVVKSWVLVFYIN
ncbi:hypothetical protein N476_18595 [Pseudoalteromonas luteoviolacea H33]|uniref:Uncharacterized protein n=1 Tax=Pseudoalteromonas luteoviolacea H33 TaxID=1365251 RepID=A0A167DZM5_9GAMM|nr:hypothetical protein N476_18595 [Pseudoalteromonas luteoviolacea H33]KZN77827.1 hypothetical protein N477_01050 [Pseudoalteromonas luteoviolacea H33-S]